MLNKVATTQIQGRGEQVKTRNVAPTLEPSRRIMGSRGLETDPRKVPFTGPKALEVSVLVGTVQ